MSQLITTILSVLLLINVPLGFVQIHNGMQLKSELMELSFAATKYVNNHGGRSEADIQNAVQQFIAQELSGKAYRLKLSDLTVTVQRLNPSNPNIWSHEDEFMLTMQMKVPFVSHIFPIETKPLEVKRTGTIQVMDYDL